MKRSLALILMMALASLCGCTIAPSQSDIAAEPESEVPMLCEAGRYQEAMRELPKAMAAWQEYTRPTGRTVEGDAPSTVRFVEPALSLSSRTLASAR